MAVIAAADRIGEMLVQDGLATREQLERALEDARLSGHRVGFSLVKLGFVAEQDLALALARQHQIPAVDLERVRLDPKLLKLIPADVALRHQVIPVRRVGGRLTVAMADPGAIGVIDDLKFITRYDIEPVIAGEFTLRRIVEREYDSADERITDLLKQFEEGDIEVLEEEEEEPTVGALRQQVEEAPVVKLINGIPPSASSSCTSWTLTASAWRAPSSTCPRCSPARTPSSAS